MPIALPPSPIIYVALSAVVAMGIFVQGVVLRRNEGRMPNAPFVHMLSFVDMIWVPVSGLALYFLDFDAIAMSVPVVFMIYMLIGFFYAANTITGTNGEMPTGVEDIVFDVRYMNFCQSFGLVFFVFCVGVLCRHYGAISVC